jgi:hypothetical protein
MSDETRQLDSGHIVGRPTLLVTFGERLDAQGVLQALERVGYPKTDVRVYYRPSDTDQVIDAVTGTVPAGEALPHEVANKQDVKLDTLVLLHPDGAQFVAVRGALDKLGPADYKYSEATE